MDDAFEAELVQAFQTPTGRPGRWEIAAAVEHRLQREAARRRAALGAATLLGVAIAAAGLAFAGAVGPLDEAARLAATQAHQLVERPLLMLLLGLSLLGAAAGGVAARDL
ncbi:hypothetical protein [Phenylobacterium sp.]|jgi:hypothetical protein|uniref:hypothetical protein n=1 Tax=Phenylobacterium sp. TaxID=1871053 RepID=UPI002F93BC01